MRIQLLVIVGLISLLSVNANAQKYSALAGIHYSTGFTVEDTRDFVNEYSWRGFNVEYKNFLGNSLAVGFSTGWNIYDELRYKELIEIDGGAISGTQIRYFNSFPVLATFDYYLGDRRSAVRPYVGLGVGTYFIIQRLEVGVFRREKETWHFGLAPQIGILVPSDYAFFNLYLRYNYAFEAENSITKDPMGFSFVSVNFGISIPTR